MTSMRAPSYDLYLDALHDRYYRDDVQEREHDDDVNGDDDEVKRVEFGGIEIKDVA